MKKKYQAVWIGKDGKGFRVSGAIAETREEAISMCSSHSAVKAGAKLDRVDEWEVWGNY